MNGLLRSSHGAIKRLFWIAVLILGLHQSISLRNGMELWSWAIRTPFRRNAEFSIIFQKVLDWLLRLSVREMVPVTLPTRMPIRMPIELALAMRQ